MRVVRLLRRWRPVTDDYHGPRLTVTQNGVRALTPLAIVVAAVFATDLVFAIDSVPAVYGITGDPYLVFATNAFALLGLRALYFVLEGALSKLTHLGFGLAAILGFIGVKLVLHWAHLVWPSVPEIPTLASLGVIVAILAVTTVTSLVASRRAPRPPRAARGGGRGGRGSAQSLGVAARLRRVGVEAELRDRRVARRLVERDRLGLGEPGLEHGRLGAGRVAAVASRWASIARARPRPRAVGATYIRLTSAVRRVPSASTSSRRRHAPETTGTPSR